MIFSNIFKKKNKDKNISSRNNPLNTDNDEAKRCANDKHNFVLIDVDKLKKIYKCDKCGLEVPFIITPPGAILKEYFGSYMNGASFKWDPSNMCAKDIVRFDIEFGDCPIISAKYDGCVIKVKNRINGSRDGWMSFPEGFFYEKCIELSDEDKHTLHKYLSSLNLESFSSSPDLLQNIGAPGFCVNQSFHCYFSNGKSLVCLSPYCDDFNKLVEVVENITGIKYERFTCETFDDAETTTLF